LALASPAIQLHKFMHAFTTSYERVQILFRNVQGGPKSKPLPYCQKIVLNRIKACQ